MNVSFIDIAILFLKISNLILLRNYGFYFIQYVALRTRSWDLYSKQCLLDGVVNSFDSLHLCFMHSCQSKIKKI